MREFDVSGLLSLSAALEALGTEGKQDNDLIKVETKTSLKEKFENYEAACREIGLAASRVSARKVIAAATTPNAKWRDIILVCKELKGRLIDETGERVFFSLSARESEFFERPRTGWERSIDRFPTIVEDVEEASKCYALSRYAASVFHSTQIVEAGLIELGSFIEVSDPKSGWTAVSKALNTIVQKPHNTRSRFERKNFSFLEQVGGTVEGLKNAWRNKISHIQGRLVLMGVDFSPEISEEILLATRAFIRRLAEGIPAPKKKDV